MYRRSAVLNYWQARMGLKKHRLMYFHLIAFTPGLDRSGCLLPGFVQLNGLDPFVKAVAGYNQASFGSQRSAAFVCPQDVRVHLGWRGARSVGVIGWKLPNGQVRVADHTPQLD